MSASACLCVGLPASLPVDTVCASLQLACLTALPATYLSFCLYVSLAFVFFQSESASCLYLCPCLHVCLSASVSMCMCFSVYKLSVYLCLSACLPVSPLVSFSVCLSVRPSVYLAGWLPACLSLRVSVCTARGVEWYVETRHQ